LSRLTTTLDLIPRAAGDGRVLEMGCYLQITPALRDVLGYGEVRGCYQGSGGSDLRSVRARDGESFECEIDLFDVEIDPFPYPSNHFDTVLCCEILEHLTQDPMQMMAEIHRILKPGGILILTTPNASSLHAIFSVLNGNHPAFYNRYPRPPQASQEALLSRHAREYTPAEIANLLGDSGFVVMRMETGEYGEEGFPDSGSARDLLVRCGRSVQLRGDCIFAVARKAALPKNRYPSWLYDD
jgi:SAM-dependent methyltransferase